MSQMTRMIRITSVPAGEAPLWVREKWVGLELPTMGPALARIYRTVGTVTGPIYRLGLLVALLRGRSKKTSGYLVSGEAALIALNEVSPEAAAWWRANAPNFVRPGRYLIFQDSACTPMSEGTGKNRVRVP
jgi:hypothetical protein